MARKDDLWANSMSAETWLDWSHEEVHKRLRDAIATKDARLLESCVLRLTTYCFKKEVPGGKQFPEDVFLTILKALKEAPFLQMEGSSNLLRLIEYEWAALSPAQKSRLLPALTFAYPKFAEWHTWFVISEILGE